MPPTRDGPCQCRCCSAVRAGKGIAQPEGLLHDGAKQKPVLPISKVCSEEAAKAPALLSARRWQNKSRSLITCPSLQTAATAKSVQVAVAELDRPRPTQCYYGSLPVGSQAAASKPNLEELLLWVIVWCRLEGQWGADEAALQLGLKGNAAWLPVPRKSPHVRSPAQGATAHCTLRAVLSRCKCWALPRVLAVCAVNGLLHSSQESAWALKSLPNSGYSWEVKLQSLFQCWFFPNSG